MCTLEQLGTVYTLNDLLDFTEYMDEEEENMTRAREAERRKGDDE